MRLNRRSFIESMALSLAAGASVHPVEAATGELAEKDPYGMLCDTTICIGCRKCEYACNRQHHLSDRDLNDFEDFSVYSSDRRMTADAFTIVNRYANHENEDKPIYVKMQCMHCLHPACVSACLVRALTVADSGAVVYDAGKCMGCRYCMYACPFQVPAYEYSKPLTPRVMKCNLCDDKIREGGGIPACAEMCPPNALIYGRRSELLEYAHRRIAEHPDDYIDHVYGEHEVGGTAWMYLASKEFTDLGLLGLSSDPVPALTEAIQHGIFKFGIPPMMLFGLLGAAMYALRGDGEPVGAESSAERS